MSLDAFMLVEVIEVWNGSELVVALWNADLNEITVVHANGRQFWNV